jgi:hypothetical protein
MICFSDECKNAKPRAASIAILSLVFHESGSKLGFPNQNKNTNEFKLKKKIKNPWAIVIFH